MDKINNKFVEYLLFPFVNLYLILVNAYNGFVYVFFRLPAMLYSALSFRLDKTYRQFKGDNMKSEMVLDLTKRATKKKAYHYSARTLEKMALLKEQLLKELAEEEGKDRSKTPIIYQYKAMNADGKIVTGTINGYCKRDVNAFLVNDGNDVYSIQNSALITFIYGESSIFKPKMKTKDLLFWLTQLSTYLKSGITLTDAIRILSKQMGNNKANEKAFKAISYELMLGENFSAALEKQGSMFPSLLVNMIKAAEASGTLIETLDDMANYYTEIDRTRKQMITALTYPTIIMLFALGVITFIMTYVVPQFTSIYDSAGAELNGITLAIINISKFLTAKWKLIILVIVLIAVLFILAYKNILVFRAVMQSIFMRLPVIGKIIIYNEITIFTKTFASLLKNNVFITESMDILSKITNNELYKNIMAETMNNVVKGNKISDTFADNWAIPDVAYYMIVTGEDTGQLAEMMEKVSIYFGEMHSNMVNSLKSLIEPIIIVLLAVVVGIVVLAVLLPIFGLYNEIG